MGRGLNDMNYKYPIEYKPIRVQFAFLVSADGTVQMQPVTPIERTRTFASEKEARAFISNLSELL